MARSSSHVLEEVVEEIFSWLPPESLIRFKCVCKSWYYLVTSLINNPDIVAKHLHNAHNNIMTPKSFVVIGSNSEIRLNNTFDSDDRIFKLNISSDDDREKDEINSVIEDLEIPSLCGEGSMSAPEFNHNFGDAIFGTVFYHCDGIICLILRENLLLCNPALWESKLLPKQNHADIEYTDGICNFWMTGFGYDPIANDYKFLGRCYQHDSIDVYSMKTDTWMNIREPKGLNEYEYLNYTMEVCDKGVCYWFSCDVNMIFSFDLNAEEFYRVPTNGVVLLHCGLTQLLTFHVVMKEE